MFANQNNTQMYTDIMNQQFALNGEPDYSTQINPPTSVQVNNPQMFTGLYWMTRWVLQNVVLNDQYFIPSWNVLSANNFQNSDYARLIARACQQGQVRNVQMNRMQDDLVLPMLEMDAAIRWNDNVQFAQQYLPPQQQQRAQEWFQRAQAISAPQQTAGWGGQSQGGFAQQQTFGQQNAWQQKRGTYGAQNQSGWPAQSQHVSGTNRSGFFNDGKQAPTSRNQAGIRTLNAALEQTTSDTPDVPVEQDSWGSRSSVAAESQPSGWGGKSSQELAAETQKTAGTSPLDDILPQNEWKVDSDDESQLNALESELGSSTMSHEVNIADALNTNATSGPATSEIGCPVLRSVAQSIYGDTLPMASIVTGPHNNILAQPHGQTDLPVESLAGENAMAERLGYGPEFVLVDYIYADYELEKLVFKIVPIKGGDADMDYMKHILSGPVAAANPKHHVEAASLTTPIARVADEGMVTKHGKQVDITKATYSANETAEFIAASIKAQTHNSTDKSIEVYDKVVLPFVLDEEFDREVFTRMADYTSAEVTAYIDDLETLPRPMQLAISAQILKDVNFALNAKLDAEVDISDFDDIVEVYDFLKGNRSEKVAELWLTELTHILSNNIRFVPDEMRIDALAALGAEIPKKTDSIVMLERERYVLALPYTLSELNITAGGADVFLVQDTSHAQLHEAVKAIFERLVKTNISEFELRLADGLVYKVAKLIPVAKTYSFTKA